MFEFEEVKNTDQEIYDSMMRELNRQEHNIELIASENFVSPAVMQAMGSHLTNKYAEGWRRSAVCLQPPCFRTVSAVNAQTYLN